MDNLDKLHKLIEGVGTELKKAFPDYTTSHMSFNGNGFISISVVRVDDPYAPFEDVKVIRLIDQNFFRGEWYEPNTNGMNEHLKKNDKLMEDDDGNQIEG